MATLYLPYGIYERNTFTQKYICDTTRMYFTVQAFRSYDIHTKDKVFPFSIFQFYCCIICNLREGALRLHRNSKNK